MRERVYRFTVPPLSPPLDYFGPDTTPEAYTSVAIGPNAKGCHVRSDGRYQG